jgi:lysophospholipase L1-like esterase
VTSDRVRFTAETAVAASSSQRTQRWRREVADLNGSLPIRTMAPYTSRTATRRGVTPSLMNQGPLLLALMLLTASLTDLNHDGTLKIGCAGDSNTALGWPKDAAALMTTATPSMGEAAGSATSVEWLNVAKPGTGACLPSMLGDGGGVPQVRALVAAGADVVIAAFGTNDVLAGLAPEAIVACYEEMETIAGGRKFFVALAPPIYATVKDVEKSDAQITALNAALAARFGTMVVDFHDGFARDLYVPGDGVHLSPKGQALRARRAVERLRR